MLVVEDVRKWYFEFEFLSFPRLGLYQYFSHISIIGGKLFTYRLGFISIFFTYINYRSYLRGRAFHILI